MTRAQSTTRHLALTVFAAALLVRLMWVALKWMRDGPTLQFPDEELHWQMAVNLVTKGDFVTDDGRFAARMPVYPLFLAIWAPLGSIGVLLARIAQCVLGAAAAGMGCEFARRTLGPRAAIAAGVLLAVDPYSVFFCDLLLTEVMFTAIAVGLTAAVWKLIASPERPGATAVAAVAALGTGAIMTRPSSFGWIVLLWCLLCVADRLRVRTLRRVGVCLLVFGVCMLPWGLRNRAVLGAPAWLSANGGVTLYDAQGPQADGSGDQSFLAHLDEIQGLGEIERDRVLYRLALQQMRSDPWRVLRLAWVKVQRTWSLTPNYSEYSGGATAIVSAVFMIVVLLFAAAGLWRSFASRRLAWVTLLALPIVYFTLLHCVFIGSLRYRIPLMPFVELIAAASFAARNAAAEGEPRAAASAV